MTAPTWRILAVRDYLNWRRAIRPEPSPQERMTAEDRKLWRVRVRRAGRERRQDGRE
jgi:hypothetical protein